MPDSNSQKRRFSIESSSSGRGGSSGMSSAEGLGGVAEFCRIECRRPDTVTYDLFPQHEQEQSEFEHSIAHSSN